MRSRVTLATIDAAAIDNETGSPLLMKLAGSLLHLTDFTYRHFTLELYRDPTLLSLLYSDLTLLHVAA